MAPSASPATSAPPQNLNQQAMMDFAFKVVGDLSAAMFGPLAYIGDRLGLFRALADSKPVTIQQLADKCKLQERYVREWTKAMIAGAYLLYDAKAQTVCLPPEHAMVLANENSPVFVGGLAQMIPDQYRQLPRIIESFEKGGGVPYSEYSHDTFEGTERLFRTGYINFLTTVWMDAMPDVKAKLLSGARVADVGCGRGAALLEMARAFPKSKFVGWDFYGPNIEYANDVAKREGIADRLHFEERNANALPQSNDFDLIMTCDCIHDMVSPEACARSIYGALAPHGTWFCIEPNVRDSVEENVNPLGRLFYSVSLLQCMTCSLAHNGAGYGAGMGEANIRRVSELAGFKHFLRLPVDNPFNQFFEIRK